MKVQHLALLVLSSGCLSAVDLSDGPAPAADRVGFPRDYREKFQVLRVVNKRDQKQVVTVYGNHPAASVSKSEQLPYPYGSVIVMETSEAARDKDDSLMQDEKGNLKPGKAVGLHVMRREKGFGEAYEVNRSGEWEYVEYKPDGSYITPPQKSATCSSCHVKAGTAKDFVYQARLGGVAGSK